MFRPGNRTFWGQWMPLPLRLIIGFGFMAHGWVKLSRGPSGFAKLIAQIGLLSRKGALSERFEEHQQAVLGTGRSIPR